MSKDGPENEAHPARSLIRAAQYVRMSTEHQKYSTENQADVISHYAAARSFEIVRTYADEGKSGLNLSGREALQALIADVTTGSADYAAILAYDVSRWGRFQDADMGAHYEYLCRGAGAAPIESLLAVKGKMGPDLIEAQYQQRPVPPGGAMIKRLWVKRYNYLPDRSLGDRVIISWDPASKTRPENERSVASV